MALQNHFRPPLSVTHPCRGFHSTWAATVAKQLNHGLLPPGFYAIPNVDLGGPIEIDVATLQESAGTTGTEPGGGTALWAPAPAAVVVPVEFPANDLVEVQVFYDEGGPRLMASIELVSPANKDRPAKRRAFVVKCASDLDSGASVVVVDVVTDRRANLHAELMQMLNVSGADWQSPTNLYAAAYRTATSEDQAQLEIWREPLTLGQPLPRMPLWLGAGLVVPLDLEQSYMTTCSDLRIRLAS
jgi:hypothetical protein